VISNVNVKEEIDEVNFYRSLSDYIDQQEQLNYDLQTQLDELKLNLRSIEYTWKEGRFDSAYHCIVCRKIKPSPHSADCWLSNAINRG